MTRRAGARLVAAWALVTAPAPGALSQPAGAAAAETRCEESFPPGAERPRIREKFPSSGKSGHALLLEIELEHPAGDRVLPAGTEGSGATAARALGRSGFHLPHPGGGSAPRLATTTEGGRARSTLTIPVVALPPRSGRNELVLPPLPIAIARASGELRTLCTSPHPIVVEDPSANAPAAQPRGNPPGARQLEEWTAAKHATIGAAAALLVGALVAALVRLWRRRERQAPPPPPARPPWEVALEELHAVRSAGLAEQGRLAEHFDRVSDAVRRYLGARYGYDGLETTTEEALRALERVSPRIAVLVEIRLFLEDADLVKFAKRTPEAAECHGALTRGEDLVRRTMPAAPTPPGPGGPAGGAP